MRWKRLVPVMLALLLLVACGAEDAPSSAPSSIVSIPHREEAFSPEGVTVADAPEGFYLGSWFKASKADRGVLIDEFTFRENGTVEYTLALWRTGGQEVMEGTYYTKGNIVNITLTEVIGWGENGPPSSIPDMEPIHLSLQLAPNDEESVLVTVLSGELLAGEYKYGEAMVFYSSALMEEKADALLNEVISQYPQ